MSTDTTVKANATPTYSEAFQSGVREEMTRNKGIFILGTDLQERGGHFAQVKGIAQEFGFDRVKDSPISEAAMIASSHLARRQQSSQVKMLSLFLMDTPL